jgi:hypothetical protein
MRMGAEVPLKMGTGTGVPTGEVISESMRETPEREESGSFF